MYRTRDFGKSWAEITNGIPPGGASNVIREDSGRKGLLFAGTEGSFMSPSTMAIIGRRFNSTCRTLPCATLRSTAMI